MLRIGYENGEGSTRLKIEGKLSGPWVSEAKRVWAELTGSETPKRQVTVDLSGVNFINAEGRKLLSRMLLDGARLESGTLLTRYIVDEVTREAGLSHPKTSQGD